MSVVTGLERILESGGELAGLTRGARVAVLAHPASIDRHARHAVERLVEARLFRLVRLFAPEHGLWGREQDMEAVATSRDPFTGLPVVSLYGSDPASLRPRGEDLAGLDAVLVDLQDVGSRYYTYVYTLSYMMEAAAAARVPVVVLDRPNPIGGVHVEGPVLHPAMSSFVGRFPLPVRHGMTVGELARCFADELETDCELRIVPMLGWSRGMEHEDTRLPWVPPSPNMPSPATARVYPGGCLVEGSVLSEGRGTTTPFELIGAPWLDGHALATAMRDRGLPGVLFRAAAFRPMFQKHAGETCGGVQVIVADRDVFRPFATYVELLREARRQAPDRFGWRSEPYEFETHRTAIDLLLGRPELRARLESEDDLAALEAGWSDELERFRVRRRDFLLY